MAGDDRPIDYDEQLNPTGTPDLRAIEAAESAERSRDLVILNPEMRALYGIAERVASTTAPVLILGATGTGKEALAHFIHRASNRVNARIKSVNCAALPPALLESMLFGHERGAFTGAAKRSAGIFEQADGGTVFLDEVGELSCAAQAALLRVLETGFVTRIGGDVDRHVDVRIVSATNRDVEQMVACGAFREDLLYRMNAITLEVPPLRARPEEILPLAQLFLRRASKRWDRPACELTEAASELLSSCPWPGNVRQLRNVIERAVLLCDESALDTKHLSLHTARSSVPPCSEGVIESAQQESRSLPAGFTSLREALRDYEARLIAQAMDQADGNQTRAAALLEVPRRTLVRKLQVLRQRGTGCEAPE